MPIVKLKPILRTRAAPKPKPSLTKPNPKPPLAPSTPKVQATPVKPARIALLMGCEYVKYANQGRLDRLPGCFDDISNMSNLLTRFCGYKAEEIITDLDPGRERILERLNQVLGLAKKGLVNHILVYYSGHGTKAKKTGQVNRPRTLPLDPNTEYIIPADFLETD
jgi:hypothetical protein